MMEDGRVRGWGVHGCHTELQRRRMARHATYQIGVWGGGRMGARASVHEGEEAPGRKGDGGARAH